MSRNPNETFVIHSFSRSSLAADLNSLAESAGYSHPSGLLQPDDDRLTSKICSDFANEMTELDEYRPNGDWSEEVTDIYSDVLMKIGFTQADC